jgi:hypothetical protein
MGKFFGPMVEYCWDLAWTFSFNNLSSEGAVYDTVEQEDGSINTESFEDIKYNHNIIVHIELQDAERNKVDVKECSVSIATTTEMLDLTGKQDLVFSEESKKLVAETVAVLKEQFAGYVA